MTSRLFPKRISNDYSGSRIAFWFFVLMTVVTIARSVVHIVAPDGGAQSIATIPLDAFSSNGAATVVHLFGLWGISQLVVGVVYALALVRYRSLIPLLYLLAVAEYLARLALAWAKPIETVGTAPGAIGNYLLPPVLLVMLVLSLRTPGGGVTDHPTDHTAE